MHLPSPPPSHLSPGAGPMATIFDSLLDGLRANDDHPALVEHGGRALSAGAFATVVQEAATGLARRGLRPDDVVGVLVPVGINRLTALYTALTAGASVLPLENTASLDTLTRALAETDAHLLVAAPELITVALELVERSRIRQVISFGQVPGTTPFRDLANAPLAAGDYDPRTPLANNGVVTCRPSALPADESMPATRMHGHAELVTRFQEMDERVRLNQHDRVLVEPDLSEPDRTVLVTLALHRGATVVTTDIGDEERLTRMIADREITVRGWPRPRRVATDSR